MFVLHALFVLFLYVGELDTRGHALGVGLPALQHVLQHLRTARDLLLLKLTSCASLALVFCFVCV